MRNTRRLKSVWMFAAKDQCPFIKELEALVRNPQMRIAFALIPVPTKETTRWLYAELDILRQTSGGPLSYELVRWWLATRLTRGQYAQAFGI